MMCRANRRGERSASASVITLKITGNDAASMPPTSTEPVRGFSMIVSGVPAGTACRAFRRR